VLKTLQAGLNLQGGSETRPYTRPYIIHLLGEQRTHRFFVIDAAYRFCQQFCGTQLTDAFAIARRFIQRDGVGYDQLIQRGILNALNRRPDSTGWVQ